MLAYAQMNFGVHISSISPELIKITSFTSGYYDNLKQMDQAIKPLVRSHMEFPTSCLCELCKHFSMPKHNSLHICKIIISKLYKTDERTMHPKVNWNGFEGK